MLTMMENANRIKKQQVAMEEWTLSYECLWTHPTEHIATMKSWIYGGLQTILVLKVMLWRIPRETLHIMSHGPANFQGDPSQILSTPVSKRHRV